MKFDKKKFLKNITKDKEREDREKKILEERVKIWTHENQASK